jgi:hypothetical protein
MMAWLGIVLALVAQSWPYTLNHIVLEAVILAQLAIFPVQMGSAGGTEPPEGVQLLWLTLLMVWGFAGVQKVVHGHYLNGESVALALLTDPGALGSGLRSLLAFTAAWSGADAFVPYPASLGVEAVTLGSFPRLFCVVTGCLIAGLEIVLPALASLPRTRAIATVGLAVAQVTVGVMSDELDFALLGLGLICLGSKRAVRYRYLALSGASVALAFGPQVFG